MFDTEAVRSCSSDKRSRTIEDFVLLLSYNGYIMVPSEQTDWKFRSLFTNSSSGLYGVKK